ncbi:hypothetical protein [Patiriisocius marinus]|uniref:Uncharacterized protein n=1 Tax=Patiriisocius marinus TaxID=1397112 RepID=A0A5J4IPM3_9FLAO|nr:hypothetical protein [Patiriisocius marinus]GER59665.1 hypothetical protein ULMA_17730 [Patiriisocius marinus]
MKIELTLLFYLSIIVIGFAIAAFIYTVRHKILVARLEGRDISKNNLLYKFVSRLFIKD